MLALCTSRCPSLSMYSSRYRDCSQHTRNPFHAPYLKQFLWRSLFDCACDLYYLTYYLEAHQKYSEMFGAQELELFEDTFAAILNGLAAFPRPESIFTKSFVYYRQHCWRIAATIYFNISLRQCPSPNNMRHFTHDLLLSLPETDMICSWDSTWEVLLWCLFMGYCGSETFEYQGWFYVEVKQLCVAKGVDKVESLEHVLQAGPYRQSCVSVFARRLFHGTT